MDSRASDLKAEAAFRERHETERDLERERKMGSLSAQSDLSLQLEEAETLESAEGTNPVPGLKRKDLWSKLRKKKNQVFLEGYVETGDEENQEEGGSKTLSKTKSLTDDDLDELKGCLDLGFGFNYEEIPELCNTLPALELCYSMSQRFLDEQHKSPESPVAASATSDVCPAPPGPIANWKISSPGDHPEDVKARLKFWAQAVACTVRLCS